LIVGIDAHESGSQLSIHVGYRLRDALPEPLLAAVAELDSLEFASRRT